MSSSLPELPIYLLHLCTIEDPAIDMDGEQFRELIVDAAEQNPIIRGMYLIEGLYGVDPDTCTVVRDEKGQWQETDETSTNPCTIRLGHATAGTFIFVDVPEGYLPLGESAAPILATLFTFAGQYWSVPVPTLIPSVDMESKK